MRNIIPIQKPTTQTGFTLVELIMVIVILGVLSAFALPKFANLTDDANEAAVKGARASVNSASGIVHAAWLAGGSTGTSVTLESGALTTTTGGYPLATVASIGTAAGLDCTNDWDCTVGDGSPLAATSIIVTKKGQISATTLAPCFVYDQLTGAVGPVLFNYSSTAPSCT
jgi:MSHA pilin protein MshA